MSEKTDYGKYADGAIGQGRPESTCNCDYCDGCTLPTYEPDYGCVWCRNGEHKFETDGGEEESVLDVLDELDCDGDTRPMSQFLKGERSPYKLSYQDWTLPLKLSGGKIVLEIHDEHHGTTVWVYREDNGMLTARPAQGHEWGVRPSELSQMIQSPTTEVTPRLKENTGV